MDSFTHIALGACMGEAFAGHVVGKKAMLWGILAQSIPDIDFIGGLWLNTPTNLLAHRGFTHSILFAVLITPLLALLAKKWQGPGNISFLRWTIFFAITILVHIILDAFNNYGVGWFEPFSHYRVTFNILYVADPFFVVAPGLALVFLILLKSKVKKRRFWWMFGLGVSFVYLNYCIINKVIINHTVKQLLSSQRIKYTTYFTTPAPLQNWLWFVVAGNDSGYYVGYRSVFDRADGMHLEYFPCNSSLINAVANTKEIKQLIRFSQGFYTIEKNHDTLVFNDLRFGQIIGWLNPKERFAFHYYLQPAIDNKLVVQRGRFAKWDWRVIRSFFTRIRGN
jgi:inner membrane protein